MGNKCVCEELDGMREEENGRIMGMGMEEGREKEREIRTKGERDETKIDG